jgi:trans-aconitate 2-methyltransferase
MRPALDLLARVGPLPKGQIVDLGCGDGAMGAGLAARFNRPVGGVDTSPAMLQKAEATGATPVLIVLLLQTGPAPIHPP